MKFLIQQHNIRQFKPGYPQDSPKQPAASVRGFTLVEVLIAIGIFAIGMVAVAAIFPTAITVQRNSNVVVDALLVADNATAYFEAVPLTYDSATPNSGSADINFYHTSTNSNKNTVEKFPNGDLAGTGAFLPLSTRAYLAGLIDSDNPDYMWVPLIQDAAGDPAEPSWTIYVMVLEVDRRSANAATPSEYLQSYAAQRGSEFNEFRFNSGNPEDIVEPGDWYITDGGLVGRIASIDNNTVTVNGAITESSFNIWLAKPVDVSAGTGVGKSRYIAILAGDNVQSPSP